MWNGHIGVVDLLLSAGAKGDAHSSSGYTALHSAAESGHVNILISLLNEGLDFDCRSRRASTPLHEGVHGGQEVTVRLLIDKGADVNAQDESYRTPLHVALLDRHASIAQILLEVGSDVSVLDQYGKSCIDLATLYGIELGVKSDGIRLAQKRAKLQTTLATLILEQTFYFLRQGTLAQDFTDMSGRAILLTGDSAHFNDASIFFEQRIDLAEPEARHPPTDIHSSNSDLDHEPVIDADDYLRQDLYAMEARIIKHDARCNGCGHQILGRRFVCKICEDGDQCARCYNLYNIDDSLLSPPEVNHEDHDLENDRSSTVNSNDRTGKQPEDVDRTKAKGSKPTVLRPYEPCRGHTFIEVPREEWHYFDRDQNGTSTVVTSDGLQIEDWLERMRRKWCTKELMPLAEAELEKRLRRRGIDPGDGVRNLGRQEKDGHVTTGKEGNWLGRLAFR